MAVRLLLVAGAPDDAILDAMVCHPMLVNRPIRSSPRGVRLCRPSGVVFGLLDRPLPDGFVKEDDTPMVAQDG